MGWEYVPNEIYQFKIWAFGLGLRFFFAIFVTWNQEISMSLINLKVTKLLPRSYWVDMHSALCMAWAPWESSLGIICYPEILLGFCSEDSIIATQLNCILRGYKMYHIVYSFTHWNLGVVVLQFLLWALIFALGIWSDQN